MAIFEGNIYAATDEGVYRATNDPSINLADFNNWQLLDVADGFPPVYSSNAIATHHNSVYLDINDALFRYQNGELTEIHMEEGFSCLLYTSPSPRDQRGSRMPSSA